MAVRVGKRELLIKQNGNNGDNNHKCSSNSNGDACDMDRVSNNKEGYIY